MQIDLGNNGGTGGDLYFGWQQRVTAAIPLTNVFYTNKTQGAEKAQFDHTNGFVLDLNTLKTGYQQRETMVWQWNPSTSQMMQSPAPDWARGFAMIVGLGKGADGQPLNALWMQSGAGAWDALAHLAPQIAGRPDETQVPIVKFSGVQNSSHNSRTWSYPLLTITNWIPRPASLSAPPPVIDTGVQPIAPAPVQPAPALSVVPAPVPATPQPIAQPVAGEDKDLFI